MASNPLGKVLWVGYNCFGFSVQIGFLRQKSIVRRRGIWVFNQILRTPLGRITLFMLVQNPEKLGYEETKDISHIDVKKDFWDNFTMMVYIAD
jgi:hypothetical protein